MTQRLFSLTDKIGLVVSRATSTGRGIVAALAHAGDDVAANVHRRPASATPGLVEAVGLRFNRVQAERGRVDILVSNVGVIRRDELDRFSEVNLNVVWWPSRQACVTKFRHGDGKIINIISLLSFQGGVLADFEGAKS